MGGSCLGVSSGLSNQDPDSFSLSGSSNPWAVPTPEGMSPSWAPVPAFNLLHWSEKARGARNRQLRKQCVSRAGTEDALSQRCPC